MCLYITQEKTGEGTEAGNIMQREVVWEKKILE